MPADLQLCGFDRQRSHCHRLEKAFCFCRSPRAEPSRAEQVIVATVNNNLLIIRKRIRRPLPLWAFPITQFQCGRVCVCCYHLLLLSLLKVDGWLLNGYFSQLPHLLMGHLRHLPPCMLIVVSSPTQAQFIRLFFESFMSIKGLFWVRITTSGCYNTNHCFHPPSALQFVVPFSTLINVIWRFMSPWVLFLMTLAWDLDETHANHWNKGWCVMHPNNSITKLCHGWLQVGWEIT